MPEIVALDSLKDLATAQPLLLRALVGASGVLLLFWGARVYRVALFAAAFGAGAAGSVALLLLVAPAVPAIATPVALLVAGVIGGLTVAGITAFVHRLGLIGVGGLVGASAAASLGNLTAAASPWWLPLVGALVGMIALPWLFPAVLRLATPAVGAVLVGWASGYPSHPWLFLGLWALGALVQLGFGSKRRREEAG